MGNRGTVSTQTISDKLKTVEEELGITTNNIDNKKAGTALLFVNGRLNRKRHSYLAKNFSLLEPLNAEIKKTCKGVDLTVLNYLIFLGLEKVKENKDLKSIEYSEFESMVESTL